MGLVTIVTFFSSSGKLWYGGCHNDNNFFMLSTHPHETGLTSYLKGQFVFILSSVGEQGHITFPTFNKTEAFKPKTITRLCHSLHFVNTVQSGKIKDVVKPTLCRMQFHLKQQPVQCLLQHLPLFLTQAASHRRLGTIQQISSFLYPGHAPSISIAPKNTHVRIQFNEVTRTPTVLFLCAGTLSTLIVPLVESFYRAPQQLYLWKCVKCCHTLFARRFLLTKNKRGPHS